MRRIVRWVKRLTAFRIGLATGLLFALLHLWEVGTRQPLPLLGRRVRSSTPASASAGRRSTPDEW